LVYWQYITGTYNGDLETIDIWARSDTDIKQKFSITGFEPYMYVPVGDKVPENVDWIRDVVFGYVSMHDEPLQKIVVTQPLAVRDHRSEFTKHYEADINFVQRFLIDADIWSCFETNSRSTIIPYTQLKKVDKVISPLVVFMDIEVWVKGRFPNPRSPTNPVIACTFWNSRNKIYLTLIYDDRYKVDTQIQVSDTWHVWYYTSPEKVGQKIKEYLMYIKPDIITGWNIGFDWEYYNAWAKKNLGITLDLQDFGAELFDLYEGYKKAKPDLGFRLKEVVVREGIIRPKDMISESFAIEMYENRETRDDFITYNKKDVEYCVKLDRGFTQVETGEYVQYDFIEDYWNQKNFVGLHDINYTLLHTKRHDPLWLRMAHKLKIVLPSQPESGEEEEGLDYGGIVFNPPVGIYPDLTIVDMSRYYPSILLSFPKETSPDVWGLIGVAVITFLSDERTKWDNEVKKYKQGTAEYTTAKLHQTVAKTFLSGAWGYFASAISRIYSKKKADFVLKTAGEGLVRMRERAAKEGHETRYGDTDSIFIKAQMTEVDSLVAALNEELKLWADEMGITETARFKIKEDRYAKATLFLPFEKAQRGVKKHYAQLIIREGDKPVDYILIKGLEAVRGNTSEITRKIQKEVLEAVLRDNTGGLIDRLQTLIKSIKTNVFDLDDITIPVNLSLDFTKSDIEQEYYVGTYYNNEYLKEGIIPGDHIRFFKVKSTGSLPSTRWVSYLDSSVITKNKIIPDYDWIIDRTLRSPCERILQAAGISWDNVEGYKNASDIFA